MNDIKHDYDCVVIGGGPAGATASTILAQHGRSVLVLEKERFPRHHIGESLMPHTWWTFKRLGVLDKLRSSDFPVKQSVQFISASDRESQPFYFPDWDPHESSFTWQIPRDRFDLMMLENARSHGANVIQGCRVREVLFDGDRAVGVRAVIDGETRDIGAKVVVDASGNAAILSRQLGIRYGDERLKNGAIYAYYRNVQLDEGRNAGATLVIRTPKGNGWFWVIPLPDMVSVGVVAPPNYLFTGRGDVPLAILEQEIADCPGIARRLTNAERVTGAYVTSDFSYRSKRISGNGWVLIGDAFGFLDPVYSSGLMLALKSGEWAADAIHEGINEGDISGERLGRFGPRFVAGMHTIRKLVYAFYTEGFSFGAFNREYPEQRRNLVRILVGDVFDDDVDDIFQTMTGWIDLPDPIDLEQVSA